MHGQYIDILHKITLSPSHPMSTKNSKQKSAVHNVQIILHRNFGRNFKTMTKSNSDLTI